jgi:hypothetical protein
VPNWLGELSDEDMDRALEWVNQVWGRSRGCPMHQEKPQWTLGNFIARASGTNEPVGTYYPLLVLTCSVCGYTAFVNAITAGVFPGNPENPTLYG